ncbi:hypothetical protein KNE206_53220 [Kitasatospora sp. NE20-6]
MSGSWRAARADLSATDARGWMHTRLWDLAHADWVLTDLVCDEAALLHGPGGRSLMVLPRPGFPSGRFIVAALVPDAIATADVDHLSPHGITVDADPARAAYVVTTRLLPRYTQAIRDAVSWQHSTPNRPGPARTPTRPCCATRCAPCCSSPRSACPTRAAPSPRRCPAAVSTSASA